jgi:pimeloyl-ACP methyl ester carboxylesterase
LLEIVTFLLYHSDNLEQRMLHHTYRSPDTSVKTVSQTLTDGRSKFGYSRTVVDAPHDEAPTSRILFLNGLFEGRFAFQPLVRRMARIALLQGHGLEVVTYDDPRVGRSAYTQSHRSARANQVARHMAARSQNTLTLAGHSRGNHSALEIAPDLR